MIHGSLTSGLVGGDDSAPGFFFSCFLMSQGLNGFFLVDVVLVYLKRSWPDVLTTTTARAAKSVTQTSKLLFSLRYLVLALEE